MHDDEATTSVRVEIEDIAYLGSAEVEVESGGDDRGRLRQIALVLSAVVVGGALIAFLSTLQPDVGQTAAGTTRQEPVEPATLSPVDPDESDADEAAVEVAEEPVLAFENVQDISGLDEIVEGPDGFIGIRSFSPPSGPVPVFRSADGLNWSQLETFVEDDDVDFAFFAEFRGLTRTEEGFSILRTAIFRPTGTQQGRVREVRRLLSEHGDRWRIDPTFPTIRNHEVPVTLGEGRFAVIERGELTGDSPLERVLGDRLNEFDEAPVCGIAIGASRAFLTRCTGENVALDLRSTDLDVINLGAIELEGVSPEPDPNNVPLDDGLSTARFQCLTELVDAGQDQLFQIRVLEPEEGDPVIMELDRDLKTPLVRFDDGTVMALAAARPAASLEACGEFGIDPVPPRPETVLQWRSDGAPEELLVPSEVGDDLERLDPESLASTGDSIVFFANQSLFRIYKGGEWTNVLEFEHPVITSYVSPDARTAAVISGTELTVFTLDSQSSTTTQVTHTFQDISLDRIVYVDDDTVIVERGPQARVLSLPPS